MTVRADEMLVKCGQAPDLTLARALIMEGRVILGGRKVLKPGEQLKTDSVLTVKNGLDAYVSRGARKLKKALDVFAVDLHGRVCVDVGASTGGFTDVMLRAGAERVYAVDVGYNLLDWRLRSDSRVVCMERTNARFLRAEDFDPSPSFGATDVSFISLKAVLPASLAALRGADKRFVALIKPQFEARQEDVGEKGVVRDFAVHKGVLTDLARFVPTLGWRVAGLDFSPITGQQGNIEYLMFIAPADANAPFFDFASIDDVIHASYDKLIKY